MSIDLPEWLGNLFGMGQEWPLLDEDEIGRAAQIVASVGQQYAQMAEQLPEANKAVLDSLVGTPAVAFSNLAGPARQYPEVLAQTAAQGAQHMKETAAQTMQSKLMILFEFIALAAQIAYMLCFPFTAPAIAALEVAGREFAMLVIRKLVTDIAMGAALGAALNSTMAAISEAIASKHFGVSFNGSVVAEAAKSGAVGGALGGGLMGAANLGLGKVVGKAVADGATSGLGKSLSGVGKDGEPVVSPWAAVGAQGLAGGLAGLISAEALSGGRGAGGAFAAGLLGSFAPRGSGTGGAAADVGASALPHVPDSSDGPGINGPGINGPGINGPGINGAGGLGSGIEDDSGVGSGLINTEPSAGTSAHPNATANTHSDGGHSFNSHGRVGTHRGGVSVDPHGLPNSGASGGESVGGSRRGAATLPVVEPPVPAPPSESALGTPHVSTDASSHASTTGLPGFETTIIGSGAPSTGHHDAVVAGAGESGVGSAHDQGAVQVDPQTDVLTSHPAPGDQAGVGRGGPAVGVDSGPVETSGRQRHSTVDTLAGSSDSHGPVKISSGLGATGGPVHLSGGGSAGSAGRPLDSGIASSTSSGPKPDPGTPGPSVARTGPMRNLDGGTRGDSAYVGGSAGSPQVGHHLAQPADGPHASEPGYRLPHGRQESPVPGVGQDSQHSHLPEHRQLEDPHVSEHEGMSHTPSVYNGRPSGLGGTLHRAPAAPHEHAVPHDPASRHDSATGEQGNHPHDALQSDGHHSGSDVRPEPSDGPLVRQQPVAAPGLPLFGRGSRSGDKSVPQRPTPAYKIDIGKVKKLRNGAKIRDDLEEFVKNQEDPKIRWVERRGQSSQIEIDLSYQAVLEKYRFFAQTLGTLAEEILSERRGSLRPADRLLLPADRVQKAFATKEFRNYRTRADKQLADEAAVPVKAHDFTAYDQKFDAEEQSRLKNALAGSLSGAFEALLEHGGFVLGEVHGQGTTWKLLRSRLSDLFDHGVDTIYVEAVRSDDLQHDIDEYLNSESSTMPRHLQGTLRAYEDRWQLKYETSPTGLLEAVKKLAAEQGKRVRVVSIDDTAARTLDPESSVDDPEKFRREWRTSRMNTFAKRIIENDSAHRGKYVALVGKAHMNTHEWSWGGPGIPGIAQRLMIPAVELSGDDQLSLSLENKQNRSIERPKLPFQFPPGSTRSVGDQRGEPDSLVGELGEARPPAVPKRVPVRVLDDPKWRHSKDEGASWFDPKTDGVSSEAIAGAAENAPVTGRVRGEQGGLLSDSVITPDSRQFIPWRGPIAYDVRRFDMTGEDGTTVPVQDHYVRLFLNKRNATPTEITSLQQRVRAGVEEMYNQGYRTPDGAQFHVTVDFVTKPGDAHESVNVDRPGGRANQLDWPVDLGLRASAHEVGHFLGLHDEYFSTDQSKPVFQHREGGGRVMSDKGLMTAEFEHPDARFKPRNLWLIENHRKALESTADLPTPADDHAVPPHVRVGNRTVSGLPDAGESAPPLMPREQEPDSFDPERDFAPPVRVDGSGLSGKELAKRLKSGPLLSKEELEAIKHPDGDWLKRVGIGFSYDKAEKYYKDGGFSNWVKLSEGDQLLVASIAWKKDGVGDPGRTDKENPAFTLARALRLRDLESRSRSLWEVEQEERDTIADARDTQIRETFVATLNTKGAEFAEASKEDRDRVIRAGEILSRVFLILQNGLKVHRGGSHVGYFEGDVARALAHGGRVNIRIPALTGPEDMAHDLTDWIGLTAVGRRVDAAERRGFSSHQVDIGKNKNGEPGTGGFKEKGGLWVSIKNVFATVTRSGSAESYGIDLAAGGLNRKDFNGQVIKPNGSHGHMFVRFQLPTRKRDGALQVGIETTAYNHVSSVGYKHTIWSTEASASPESSFYGHKQDRIGEGKLEDNRMLVNLAELSGDSGRWQVFLGQLWERWKQQLSDAEDHGELYRELVGPRRGRFDPRRLPGPAGSEHEGAPNPPPAPRPTTSGVADDLERE